jgi:hypothetical protein
MTGISQVDIIKNSVISGKIDNSYVAFCQICGWYGYPQEKTLVEFKGIRPEDEDGYIEVFTEYDYDTETGQKGNLHIHKYHLKLVHEAVELALKMRNDGGCQE